MKKLQMIAQGFAAEKVGDSDQVITEGHNFRSVSKKYYKRLMIRIANFTLRMQS